MGGIAGAAPNIANNTGQGEFVREFACLPLEIALETPLANFSVRDLLALANGTVVRSTARLAERIPVLVNGRLIAFAKLEVSNHHLALRITELA